MSVKGLVDSIPISPLQHRINCMADYRELLRITNEILSVKVSKAKISHHPRDCSLCQGLNFT